MLRLAACGLLLGPVVRLALASAPQANLTSGLWTGTEIEVPDVDRRVEAFLGVRYAEPPVGDLRFKRPVPRAYGGEEDGTSFGPACFQGNTFYVRKGISFEFTNLSEDCLHVNIYRPQGARDAPVVAYVYGGTFIGGFNGMFLYDPEELVARHGIIVATINYRLSVMGFLSMNTTEAPGNQGLHDILLAIRFVKENARALGGDPDQLTVWGQSAGGFAAGFLMSSPAAKGLFKRVILQSASPVSAASQLRLNSLNGAVSAASVVNCVDPDRRPEDQLDEMARCLKKVDAQTLFDGVNKGLGDHYTITFQPQIGIDDLIPEFPFQADRSKIRLNDDITEVLTSTVSNEGAMFVEGVLERFQFNSSTTAEDFISVSRIVLRVLLDMPLQQIRQSTLEYMPVTLEDLVALRTGMSQLFGDLIFECPTDLYSDFLADRGVKLYRFLWDQRPPTSYWPDWAKATHCDDIPYTMGSQLHLGEKAARSGQASEDLINYYKMPMNDEHRKLVLDSLKMIADFVKNGRPSRPDGSAWPQYTSEGRRTIRVDTKGFEEFQGPRSGKCFLWDDLLLDKVPPIGSGVQPTVESSKDDDDNSGAVKNNTIAHRPRRLRKKRPRVSSSEAGSSAVTPFVSHAIILTVTALHAFLRLCTETASVL